MRVALVFFCLLVFALLDLSVEMCADSLSSESVLKAFLRPEQKIVVFLVPQTVIWEACCLNLGTLGELFCHLGGTLGDIGSSREDMWGSRLASLGPHSESFSDTNGSKFCVVFGFVSMSLSIPFCT